MKKFILPATIGTICMLCSSVFIGCTNDTDKEPSDNEINKISLNVSSLAFNAASLTNDKTQIQKLDGYLYSNGTLIKIYQNLSSNEELTLPIIFYNGIKASLFLVANTENITTSLNSLVVGSSKESEFPATFTAPENISVASLALARKVDLSTIDITQPLDIKLKHTHARIDLKIEESDVQITSIEFKNLPNTGLLVRDTETPANYNGTKFNFKQTYSQPITASQTIGYINEGAGLDIPVSIIGKFSGLEIPMGLTLPAKIERNKIYTIKVTKVGVSLTAQVEADDWEDGGTTETKPL